MRLVLKLTLIASAHCLVGAISTPSEAQQWRYAPPAEHYSIYQNPDGTYDSPADLSRDIWGVPCGVECVREAQARWSRYAATHPESDHRAYRYRGTTARLPSQ